ALRMLMEKYREGQKELHCVFVDLEKAYDRVERRVVVLYEKVRSSISFSMPEPLNTPGGPMSKLHTCSGIQMALMVRDVCEFGIYFFKVLPENNHKPHSLLHLQRNQKSDVMASKNRESGKDTEPGPPPPMATTGSYKDEVYFMTVALLFAKKSPDPNTKLMSLCSLDSGKTRYGSINKRENQKVGACIVNQEGKIVGIGYNKMPNGCENADFPWKRGKYDDPTTKHQYVCHAELNAIVNKTSVDVKGCTIYVTLFPCNQCARILIQSGVRNLVYLSNKRKDRPDTNVSNKLLDTAGVTCRQFTAQGDVCALLKSIDPNAE
ncbi:deoxycytidylate deaminase, partial [Silurus meridionalis]